MFHGREAGSMIFYIIHRSSIISFLVIALIGFSLSVLGDEVTLNDDIYNPGEKISIHIQNVNETLTIQIDQEPDVVFISMVEPVHGILEFEFTIPSDWLGEYILYISSETYYDTVSFEVEIKDSSQDDESTDSPVIPIVTASVLIVLLGSVTAFSSTEAGRFQAMMLLIPLFTRLKEDDILAQETRWKIMGAVYAQPGITYSELKRVLNLENGTLIHHTHVLKKNKKIVTRLDGPSRRYYSISMKKQSVAMVPGPRLNRLQIEILANIEEYPGYNQKQISKELNINQSKLSYHLRQLEDKNYLEVAQGKHKRYFLRGGPLSYSCEKCHNQFSSEKVPRFCPNCGHVIDDDIDPMISKGELQELT